MGEYKYTNYRELEIRILRDNKAYLLARRATINTSLEIIDERLATLMEEKLNG